MQAIRVENLSKTFRVKRKEKGMRGSIKAIMHPQTEDCLLYTSPSPRDRG